MIKREEAALLAELPFKLRARLLQASAPLMTLCRQEPHAMHRTRLLCRGLSSSWDAGEAACPPLTPIPAPP